jgi:hypothetical protein
VGLDISYYSNLKPAPDAPRDEYGEVDYAAFFTAHDGELDLRAPDLAPGVYAFDKMGKFRAGSYGGYNQWRAQLAQLAGYPSDRYVWDHEQELLGKPFVELISFSDCEGVIGPAVSAKLAGDFAAFQAKADAHEDEWFRSKYADWRAAFEAAAKGGAVDFH